MKVTIIITTYNRPLFLKRAIMSALSQTYNDLEIIVVDDNEISSQARAETEKIMSEFPEVLYLKNEKNLGSCYSRNRGLKVSQGDLLCYLDDDDEMLVEHVKNLVIHFKKNYSNELAMVYSQCFVRNENGKILSADTSTLDLNENHLEVHLMHGINPTSCILFSKKAIKSVGGWIQIPCGQEDYLVLRLFAAGYIGKSILDRTVNIYFHNSGRISVGKNKIEGVKYLYKLKSTYLKKVSPKVARQVKYLSFMELALANKEYSIRDSMKSYIKMCVIDPFNRRNISTLLALFLGINNYLYVKSLLKNIYVNVIRRMKRP